MSGEDKWQEGDHGYQAFLLRCWMEEDPNNGAAPGQTLGWRFALLQLEDDKWLGFACFDDLVAFLSSEFGESE